MHVYFQFRRLRRELEAEQFGSRDGACGGRRRSSHSAGNDDGSDETRPSGSAARVVVVKTGRLEELHRNAGHAGHELAGQDRTSNEQNEDEEHDEVQNRVANDTPPSQPRLLQ